MTAPMITPTMIRDWTKGLDTALTGYTEALMAGDAEGVGRFSIQIEARVRGAVEAAFRAAFALAAASEYERGIEAAAKVVRVAMPWSVADAERVVAAIRALSAPAAPKEES